jgi:hypothetical protein
MIELYEGLPGTGKTLQVTERLVKERRHYDEVITNYGLELPDPAPPVRRIRSGPEFIDLVMELLYEPDGKNRVIALDEAHSLMDARHWTRTPDEALMFFAQPRKAKIDLFLTAQDWSQIEQRVRIVTNYVWRCNGWGKDFNFRNECHLIFWANCYAWHDYARKGERAKVRGTRMFTYRKANKFGQYYDTMEVLKRIDLSQKAAVTA